MVGRAAGLANLFLATVVLALGDRDVSQAQDVTSRYAIHAEGESHGLAQLTWGSDNRIAGIFCTLDGPVTVRGTNPKSGFATLHLEIDERPFRSDYELTRRTEELPILDAVSGDNSRTVRTTQWEDQNDPTELTLIRLSAVETSFLPNVDTSGISQLIKSMSPAARKQLEEKIRHYLPIYETIRVVFLKAKEQELRQFLEERLDRYSKIVDMPMCPLETLYLDIENAPTDYIATLIMELIESGLVVYAFPHVTATEGGDGNATDMLTSLEQLGITASERSTSAEISKALDSRFIKEFTAIYRSLADEGGIVLIQPTKFKFRYEFKIIARSRSLCKSSSDWERLQGIIDFRIFKERDEFPLIVDVREAHFVRYLVGSKFDEQDFNAKNNIPSTMIKSCLKAHFETKFISRGLVLRQ